MFSLEIFRILYHITKKPIKYLSFEKRIRNPAKTEHRMCISTILKIHVQGIDQKYFGHGVMNSLTM